MKFQDTRDVLLHFVETIGERLPTSLAEAHAAAYIDGLLRRAGCKVTADTFDTPIRLTHYHMMIALVAAASALLAGWLPPMALVLACLLYGVVLYDTFYSPWHIAPASMHNKSQNIIGTRAATDHIPMWRMVLLAALDTPPPPEGIRFTSNHRRNGVVGRIVACTMLLLLSTMCVFQWHPYWWYAHSMPVAYLVARLIMPPHTTLSEHVAAAAALTLLATVADSVANQLNVSPLQHVELWFVALGATTVTHHGIENLTQRYPFPRNETLFVVFDQSTNLVHSYTTKNHDMSNTLSYAQQEGMCRAYRADELLVSLCQQATADATIPLTHHRYMVPSSLAMPLYQQGYRILTLTTPITLTSIDAQQYMPSVVQTINQTTLLVHNMVTLLDTHHASTTTTE